MSYTRQQYVNNECSHEVYYGQFVTPTVVALVEGRIGLDRVRASTDQAFNDIPLHLWDRLADSVRSLVGSAVAQANGGGTSLSDMVSVAKAAAQQIRGN